MTTTKLLHKPTGKIRHLTAAEFISILPTLNSDYEYEVD